EDTLRYDPAFGLAFGTDTDARGYALRSNAQNLDMQISNSFATSVMSGGQDSGGFVSGDAFSIDARLVGGSTGNYTVRFYVEKDGGDRFGPYDISGIASLDHTWMIFR